MSLLQWKNLAFSFSTPLPLDVMDNKCKFIFFSRSIFLRKLFLRIGIRGFTISKTSLNRVSLKGDTPCLEFQWKWRGGGVEVPSEPVLPPLLLRILARVFVVQDVENDDDRHYCEHGHDE
mgnify:CR=1 FL=1